MCIVQTGKWVALADPSDPRGKCYGFSTKSRILRRRHAARYNIVSVHSLSSGDTSSTLPLSPHSHTPQLLARQPYKGIAGCPGDAQQIKACAAVASCHVSELAATVLVLPRSTNPTKRTCLTQLYR